MLGWRALKPYLFPSFADRTLASTSRDEPTPKERQVAAEVAAEAVRPGALG